MKDLKGELEQGEEKERESRETTKEDGFLVLIQKK